MCTECLLSHRAQNTHNNHVPYTHAHFTDRGTTEAFIRNLTKVILLGNGTAGISIQAIVLFSLPQCLSYTFNEHYYENYMTQSTWEGWDEGEKHAIELKLDIPCEQEPRRPKNVLLKTQIGTQP